MIDRFGAMGRPLSLRQIMDRMLEDAFVMPREGGEGWGGPSMDVYEENDNLVVEAHVPGLRPDDLDITVERGMLTISGKTEQEQERKDRNYLLREKRTGRFSRTIQLPTTYHTEQCQANYEHGVLRLVFPKAEEAKPRRIQVGSGGQQSLGGRPTGDQATASGIRMKTEDRS